jgi:hypothetical protein
MTASSVAQLAEESSLASKIDIGLKNGQIMQRYLVRRIHREIEFMIKECDGAENTGFITGFDDKCIQMSLTPKITGDEPRATLIFWPVAKIEETGRRVHDLPAEHAMKMRNYTHALRKQCEVALSADKDPDRRVPSPSLQEVPFSVAR